MVNSISALPLRQAGAFRIVPLEQFAWQELEELCESDNIGLPIPDDRYYCIVQGCANMRDRPGSEFVLAGITSDRGFRCVTQWIGVCRDCCERLASTESTPNL